MGIAIVAIVVVALIAAVAIVLVARRRRAPGRDDAPDRPAHPDPEPMTGLETALDRATDRSGRPIRERLEAEAQHVDQLREPDDTGPLLRRALDRVATDRAAAAKDRPVQTTDHGAPAGPSAPGATEDGSDPDPAERDPGSEQAADDGDDDTTATDPT